jgi:hypothetical protein
MAEYPITVQTLPTNTCYPVSVQELVNMLAEYITVQINQSNIEYIVNDSAPSSADTDRIWFQTQTPPGAGEYGAPKAPRKYTAGQWREFTSLSQGDIVVVESLAQINSPWGEPGFTYSFGDTGIPNYTPPTPPTPPEGFKYKVYVGYWTSKTP